MSVRRDTHPRIVKLWTFGLLHRKGMSHQVALSNSDAESSSDHDTCSGEDEQALSSTRKNITWDDIDEQRLLAYKKESKSWGWIFGKFPSRTQPAIRTRWNMLRPRDE